MLRPTEIAVLTTAPADYDYTRVTRTLLTGVKDRHGTTWRLVAIDQDPDLGTFGQNQTMRYGSGLHASHDLSADEEPLGYLGLPDLELLLACAADAAEAS
jgi:hypothetical protein